MKAHKTTLSVRELQKTIGQWKSWKITDSTVSKLLDLMLGMTAYMNEDAVYPVENFYDISKSLKFKNARFLVEAVRQSGAFGIVPGDNVYGMSSFYSCLWKEKEKTDDSAETLPVKLPQGDIYNIYTIQDNKNNISSGGIASAEKSPEAARNFFHLINKNPADKMRILTPLIDGFQQKEGLTREDACANLVHHCFGGKDSKGEKDKKNTAGMMYQCIAYVNYINGQPVNVKYRSCDATGSGYAKCWSQDSPTTPCPPYNIDCINPLLIAEENIPRLIVTEGERDVLTLREAGYPYVISVPNGAASDLSKGFEAFRPWLDRVRELVICGDSDLPGRTLVKHLAGYFGTRCLFTVLPGGCKDISDVLVAYGADVVREIIGSACPHHTSDIITVSERADGIMDVLNGNYDHGYDVGYGPLTDRVFHPTDQGGLIIATGKPNSGKTDFLNDLSCRLMAKTGRNVCYLSFEIPDKNKHMANLIRHHRPVPLHGNGNRTLQHGDAGHQGHADAGRHGGVTTVSG